VVQGAGYISLFLAAGLVVFVFHLLPSTLKLDRARSQLRGMVRISAAVALGATALTLPLTVSYQQGLHIADGFAPSAWSATSSNGLWGLAVLAVGLALIISNTGDTPPVRRTRLLALSGVVLAVASPALTGHSRAFSPQAPVVATDIVHVLAGSVWLGGLVGLALTLPALSGRGEVAAQTLARFSTAAAGALVALVATGSLLAWRILASWDNLFGSTYGRLLLVKIGVVMVAVAIAAWIRFVLLPRARASVGFAHRRTTFNSIGRTIVAEAALLVGVLLSTGFLVNQSPREAAGAVPAGQTGAQAAQLGDLKVVATMTPRVQGQNTLLVQIQDTAGEPAESTRLPVISVRSAGVDLGAVPVTSSGVGAYRVEVVIPTSGRWEIQISLRLSKFENPVATLAFEVPAS